MAEYYIDDDFFIEYTTGDVFHLIDLTDASHPARIPVEVKSIPLLITKLKMVEYLKKFNELECKFEVKTRDPDSV